MKSMLPAVYVNASTRFTDGFEFGSWGRDRYQYPEITCERPYGLRSTYKYINILFMEMARYVHKNSEEQGKWKKILN